MSSLGGCVDFREPLWDASEGKLIAIPFRDLTEDKNRRWYGESKRGVQLIRFFREWSENEHVANFVIPGDEQRVIRSVTEWLDNRIRPRDWRRITAGIEVDFLLIGEIIEFRLKQPNDVNVYRGSARMNYRIISAVTGKTVYSTPVSREVRFPIEQELEIPLTNMDQKSVKLIEIGLVKGLGGKLGKDLYGYYKH